MPVNRPYRRTYRQFTDGRYNHGGNGAYVTHPNFANSPAQYVRAFLLLLKDLQEVFDYVEPADINLSCYSYRIHALLVRACVEVEANCKAILKENGYTKMSDMNMSDYKKINVSHHLSSYEIQLPYWNGANDVRCPFKAWSTGAPLPWYKAYNTTKHDRHEEFEEATFGHLIDACCGLLVILSAQFGTNEFTPSDSLVTIGSRFDGMEIGIGGYFRVKFPDDWPDEMQYEFNWQKLQYEPNPFQTIDYVTVT